MKADMTVPIALAVISSPALSLFSILSLLSPCSRDILLQVLAARHNMEMSTLENACANDQTVGIASPQSTVGTLRANARRRFRALADLLPRLERAAALQNLLSVARRRQPMATPVSESPTPEAMTHHGDLGIVAGDTCLDVQTEVDVVVGAPELSEQRAQQIRKSRKGPRDK